MRWYHKVVAFSLVLAIPLIGVARATAPATRSRYVRTDGPGPKIVVLQNAGNTEDSCLRAREVGWKRLPNGSAILVLRCATP